VLTCVSGSRLQQDLCFNIQPSLARRIHVKWTQYLLGLGRLLPLTLALAYETKTWSNRRFVKEPGPRVSPKPSPSTRKHEFSFLGRVGSSCAHVVRRRDGLPLWGRYGVWTAQHDTTTKRPNIESRLLIHPNLAQLLKARTSIYDAEKRGCQPYFRLLSTFSASVPPLVDNLEPG
jgi:hypothetical protein